MFPTIQVLSAKWNQKSIVGRGFSNQVNFFFSGQKMYGARNEHFSVKMIISIFLAMKICIQLVSCTICQHGFVAPKVMSSNCCCLSEKPLNHQCIQLYDRQNGVTSLNVLIICTNFWIAKLKHQCPKIKHECSNLFGWF